MPIVIHRHVVWTASQMKQSVLRMYPGPHTRVRFEDLSYYRNLYRFQASQYHEGNFTPGHIQMFTSWCEAGFEGRRWSANFCLFMESFVSLFWGLYSGHLHLLTVKNTAVCFLLFHFFLELTSTSTLCMSFTFYTWQLFLLLKTLPAPDPFQAKR